MKWMCVSRIYLLTPLHWKIKVFESVRLRISFLKLPKFRVTKFKSPAWGILTLTLIKGRGECQNFKFTRFSILLIAQSCQTMHKNWNPAKMIFVKFCRKVSRFVFLRRMLCQTSQSILGSNLKDSIIGKRWNMDANDNYRQGQAR